MNYHVPPDVLAVPVRKDPFNGAMYDAKHPHMFHPVHAGRTTHAGGEVPKKHRRFIHAHDFASLMQHPHSGIEVHQ